MNTRTLLITKQMQVGITTILILCSIVNQITEIASKPAEQKVTAPAPSMEAPKDATLVAVSASSEETNKRNYIWHAVGGSEKWLISLSMRLVFRFRFEMTMVEQFFMMLQTGYTTTTLYK